MIPAQALASTTPVAEGAGHGRPNGRIAPGDSAGMIAVDGNPLADVTALERVDRVLEEKRVAE